MFYPSAPPVGFRRLAAPVTLPDVANIAFATESIS